MRCRDWLSWWFAEEKQRRDKVTASKMGGFASKIEISLGFYWARATGLNVIDSSGEEAVKKYNGIRFGYSKFAKKPMPAFINMFALVQSMQRRQGMKMVFGTRSDENRCRFFVCLHGAGPICKQIKDVYWGGQANEKRHPVWTSLKNKFRLQNHPGWTVTWTVKYLWKQPAVYLQSGFHSIECVWKRGELYRFPSLDALW